MTTSRHDRNHKTGIVQESSVQHDDMNIGYNWSGNASANSALIMLHGLASNATRWREFMQHSSLRDTFYLLAMDLRGHGRSLTFRTYQRTDWVDDVHFMLKNLTQSSILAGHSMGAQIALDYACQYNFERNKLAGLVLIDPIFPQALDGSLKRVARFRGLIRLLCLLLRTAYRAGLHRHRYPYRDLQALDEQTRNFLQANPDKSIADLYMNPFADLAYIPLANYLQDLYEVTRPLESLQNINVPVLVLLSAGASTSQVEQNRKILGDIPALEIKTIDADHWLLTEKPREARDTIDAWCRKITGL